MYSITSRRWFFPAILVLALLAEMLGLRATWRTDTQGDSKLHKLQVRSGYALLLENPAAQEAQPILSYNATSQHNHRLTVDMRSARLSDESLRLLAMLNPPKRRRVPRRCPCRQRAASSLSRVRNRGGRLEGPRRTCAVSS